MDDAELGDLALPFGNILRPNSYHAEFRHTQALVSYHSIHIFPLETVRKTFDALKRHKHAPYTRESSQGILDEVLYFRKAYRYSDARDCHLETILRGRA